MFKLKNVSLTITVMAVLTVIVIITTFGIGPGTNTDIITKTFPSVKGIDLLGKTINVPESLQGNKIIIAIGFKREHQKEIDHWTSIISKFLKEDTSLKFYIVPVIYKTNFLNRLWINNSMRFGTSDKEERRKIITVYTDQKKFANHLNMQTSEAYIVILDKEKNILKVIEGNPDAKKIKELSRVLEFK